jgi:hypothetical protein
MEGECPDLSGSWANKGTVSFSQGSWSGLLSYQLTKGFATPAVVGISARQNQLVVEFDPGNPSGKIAATLRPGEDFKCEQGALWLQPKIRSDAGGLGGYRATTVLGFRRTTNGNLIGEERLSSVGAALWVIPVVGSQTFWYRWFAEQ